MLVPTRTLAQQIFNTLIDTLRYTGLRGAAIYGGTSLEIDIAQLWRGCDIMVATPGRLIHLLQNTTILEGECILSLCNTRWFVMDEADAMLAPNLGSQLSTIYKYLPKQHHLWLFTSTLREACATEALRMLNKQHVRIGKETLTGPQPHGLSSKAVSQYSGVRQDIIPVKAMKTSLDTCSNTSGIRRSRRQRRLSWPAIQQPSSCSICHFAET